MLQSGICYSKANGESGGKAMPKCIETWGVIEERVCMCVCIYIYGGFLKIRGTILGVSIIRIVVYWGLYWGPLILGNYHIYRHRYMRIEFGVEGWVAGC